MTAQNRHYFISPLNPMKLLEVELFILFLGEQKENEKVGPWGHNPTEWVWLQSFDYPSPCQRTRGFSLRNAPTPPAVWKAVSLKAPVKALDITVWESHLL